MEEKHYMTKPEINRELDKIANRLDERDKSDKQDRHNLRDIMTIQNDHLGQIHSHIENIDEKINSINNSLTSHEKEIDETKRWKAYLEGQIFMLRILVLPIALGMTIFILQFVFNKFFV